MASIIIEDNIYLEPMVESNVNDLFLFIDSNRTYFREFLNWVDSIKVVEDEQKFIDSLRSDETSQAFVILFEGRIVGSIGFICIDKLNKNAQIGYCIDEHFQGKGIITKACKRVIEFGFSSLNLERIEFRIAKHNSKSKAVMKRLSADFEGVLRKSLFLNNRYIDCEIYSILKNR